MLEQVLNSKWKAVHLDNSLCGIGSCIGWGIFLSQLGYGISWSPRLGSYSSMSGKGEFHCSTQSEDIPVWDEACKCIKFCVIVPNP